MGSLHEGIYVATLYSDCPEHALTSNCDWGGGSGTPQFELLLRLCEHGHLQMVNRQYHSIIVAYKTLSKFSNNWCNCFFIYVLKLKIIFILIVCIKGIADKFCFVACWFFQIGLVQYLQKKFIGDYIFIIYYISVCLFVWNSLFPIKYDTLKTEREIYKFNLYIDH